MLLVGYGDGGYIAATGLRAVEPEAVGWTSTEVGRRSITRPRHGHRGGADMCQGARTALAQMVAAELGVMLDSIRVITPDTDQTLDAGPSCASRVTYVAGNAARAATAVIRETLLATAANLVNRPVGKLTLRGGYVDADEEHVLSLAEVAAAARATNLPLHSDGFYAMEYPGERPDFGYPHASEVFSFGAQIARAALHPNLTGEVATSELAPRAG